MAVTVGMTEQREEHVLQTFPFVCRSDVLFGEPLKVDVKAVAAALRQAGPLSDVAVLAVRGQRPFPIYPFLSALQTSRVEVLHVLWQESRSFVLTVAADALEPLRQVVEKRLREYCDFNVLAGLGGPLPETRLESWYAALEQALVNCNRCVLDRRWVTASTAEVFRPDFSGVTDRLLQAIQRGETERVLAELDEAFATVRAQWWPLRDVADLCAQVMVLVLARPGPPYAGRAGVKRSPREWLDMLATECCKLEVLQARLKETVAGMLAAPREPASLGRSVQILRVMEWIEREYAAELNLDQLASRAYLSPGHLSKRFKQETGMTVHEYIIQTRLAKAKELLLRELNLKVYEVGARVGYPDATYFNKLFKRHVGVTPKEYRDRGGA
jgi:two-component system response regulator YesN